MSLQFKNDADMENFARKLVDGAQTNNEFFTIIHFGRESLVKNPELLILILHLWSTKKDWPIWSLTAEVLHKCKIELAVFDSKSEVSNLKSKEVSHE